MGTGDLLPGAQSSGTSRESQAKFKDGIVWRLYKGPVGTGPAKSVFGEKDVLQLIQFCAHDGSGWNLCES